MLVSFKFECLKHGEFDHYFNTAQYPNRDFPLLTVICPEKGCNRLAEYQPKLRTQPDDMWMGKDIDSLGLKNITSKQFLKRYLRTNGLSQLTSDEIGGHRSTQKTTKERIKAHINSPKETERRKQTISKILDENFGVIDGVK